MVKHFTMGMIANNLLRRLCQHGYNLKKSSKSKRSYYYTHKTKKILPLRLSDHYMHNNQYLHDMVEIIINDNGVYVNNKEVVTSEGIDKVTKLCTLVLERVSLEILLYNNKYKIDPISGFIIKKNDGVGSVNICN